MVKLKECMLPNGLEVHYASKTNLDMLQQEFDDELYNKHGIELRDGDCIFDVGANIGFFVMYLNQELSNASVYSFEPIPDTYDLLKKNMGRHNHLDLKTFNFGLSNQPGQATFTHYPKTNICSTMFPQGSPEYFSNSRRFVLDEIRKRGAILRTLVDRTPNFLWWPVTEAIRRYYRSEQKIECQLSTMSTMIDEHNIETIDYLKIDTEGAEMNVLEGIRDDHWPRIRQAVIEVHDGLPGLKKVVALLEKHGFEITTEQPCPHRDHLQMVYARKAENKGALSAATTAGVNA